MIQVTRRSFWGSTLAKNPQRADYTITITGNCNSNTKVSYRKQIARQHSWSIV